MCGDKPEPIALANQSAGHASEEQLWYYARLCIAVATRKHVLTPDGDTVDYTNCKKRLRSTLFILSPNNVPTEGQLVKQYIGGFLVDCASEAPRLRDRILQCFPEAYVRTISNSEQWEERVYLHTKVYTRENSMEGDIPSLTRTGDTRSDLTIQRQLR